MKSKFVFGLVAALVVLALAPTSFAQVNIQIFNTPSPQEVKTNRTAETSDPLSAGAGITVSGSVVATSNLSSTNLILTFPAPVTVGAVSQQNIPNGDAIRIVAATGVFANATILTRGRDSLTIALLTTDIVGNSQSGSFRIVGTRIDANGLTAPANGSASLSSSANNFFLSTTTFPVITALGDGIGSISQTVLSGNNPGPITIFTNRTVVNGTSSLVIAEGFNFAWRTEAQNEIDSPGAAGVGATQVRLTVTGIPATTSITVTATSTTGSTVSSISNGTLTSTANTTVFTFSATNPNAIDSLQINLTGTTAPTSTPTVGAITATATLFPVGNQFGTGGDPPTLVTQVADPGGTNISVPVPRYLATEVGPATIGNVVAANTTLLVPYAVRLAGYDTGISIANTTLDPFGSASGGATPIAGNLIIDFFPRTSTGAGTAFSLTTSTSVRPGIGLSADGTLAAGSTWTALLSELMTAAGQTGDFTGYIFIRANFLLGHGSAFVSDFNRFTSASPVLVLPSPSTTSRNTLGGGTVESLNN
jgi:hypothetical protein